MRVDDPMLSIVATRRKDKINCDEEERLRLGYEIRTAVRFADRGGVPVRTTARLVESGDALAALTYGRPATLWRINMGWRQRANYMQLRYFVIDRQCCCAGASPEVDFCRERLVVMGIVAK